MQNPLEYPFEGLLQKKKSLKKLLNRTGLPQTRVAILSGSTIGEIRDVLEVFLLHAGLEPVFWIGEYNRYYEEAIFPNDSLMSFRPDIIYIHTTMRNLGESMYERLLSVWERLKEDYHCAIIQNNFEMPAYTFLDNHERINLLNLSIHEYAGRVRDFYVNDINYVSACYGLEKWFDELCWHCYKYAMDVNAIPVLAHNIAGIVKSIYGRNQKCLALDLDGTIWGGVVGETGPAGIELGMDTAMGEAYIVFQRYVKGLYDIGVILAVCSKNDEKAARSAFSNPNMILKLEDFSVFCANWESKADNIEYIARTLNILPSAIVFIDDNPAEQELVRSVLPDVKVPYVKTVTDFIRAIDRAGYFNVANISAEDMSRNNYYKADALRSGARKSYDNYQDYLESLKMTSEISPLTDVVMERVTQLINKTNQFNPTIARITLSEAVRVAKSPVYVTAYATLEDKFGSNGIVSAFIGEIVGNCLHVRVWVMSCRVFKRDLELAVFDHIVEVCRARDVEKIAGYYIESEKNRFVACLYEDLGFIRIEDGADNIFPESTLRWNYVIPEVYEHKNKVITIMR